MTVSLKMLGSIAAQTGVAELAMEVDGDFRRGMAEVKARVDALTEERYHIRWPIMELSWHGSKRKPSVFRMGINSWCSPLFWEVEMGTAGNPAASVLEKLRGLNPALEILPIEDAAFQRYGKVLRGYHTAGLQKLLAARRIASDRADV